MDINVLRMAVTVTGLVLFLALWAWAWSRKRQPDFEAAAALPFLDDAPEPASPPGTERTPGEQA